MNKTKIRQNLQIQPSTDSPLWTREGNIGTTAGTDFIGTVDAQDLVFKTDNIEFARLTSTGSLGINDSTPFAKLQVNTSGVVGALVYENGATPSNGSNVFGFPALMTLLQRNSDNYFQLGYVNEVCFAAKVANYQSGPVGFLEFDHTKLDNTFVGANHLVPYGGFGTSVGAFGSATIYGLYSISDGVQALGAIGYSVPDASTNVGLITLDYTTGIVEITQGTAGNSGLKFTNLLSTSTVSPANGKALTVDSSGNVILVSTAGSTTNTLANPVNTITSTVNGVSATANAVNTVSNTSAVNNLSTEVNGVVGSNVNIINTNVLTSSAGNVNSTINGVSSGDIAIAGLTTSNLSASAGILNTQLANSSTTINGTTIALGATGNITTPLSSITAATATNTIDSLNFAQTWNWTTATTQNPLSLNANALTTGNLLSLSSTALTTGAVLSLNGGAGNAISSPVATNIRIITGTTGALTLDSGTTGSVNLGTNANAKTITIGNTTGISSLTLESGTGGINIGSSAVAKTITIGNSTGATAVSINNGTGALNLGTNAIAHTVSIGNATGATALNFTSGTGLQSYTSSAITTQAFNFNANSFTNNASAGAFNLNLNALTSGTGMFITSSNATVTGSLLQVNSNSTGAFASGGVRFNFTGAHTANGVEIDDVTATGNALAINVNSLTTGSALNISTTNTNLNSTNGFFRLFNNSAPVTGTGLFARIQPNNTAGSGLTVLNNGNVGVGIASPTARLHVTSPITTDVPVAYFLNTQGATDFRSYIYIGSNPGTDWKIGKDITNTGNSRFSITDSSNNERLTILTSGNVGIGTASPTSGIVINNSFAQTPTVITGTYSALSTDSVIICNNGATNITITLPDPTTCIGREITVTRYSTSTGTITVNNSGTPSIQSTNGAIGTTATVDTLNANKTWVTTWIAVTVGATTSWIRIG